ncbi:MULTISPECIES: RIP metalloprotease RseP [unclassified Lactobacillus]|uniref:RIP metalloprotease RseP n=1 Tax=unclassified Lactobacillus TaxID=2620435 RepID=UPI00226A5A8D|nr:MULTISPECIES: RIP metalloprotease RseP [unclassified Lactobacillus]MCX8721762.1 RIP metalloprotease RseP [Lactobacillus sp. B4010]MCX8722943.1 RIP metalloprotease RseP [Lactobacillus sp. B4005]MCX8732450.1 RIP metalloprotease RseP [Lactobacillus sp. B4015]MCX8734670.1 RIP metalloprotease RseP [Lactobacillus sp. B4012]
MKGILIFLVVFGLLVFVHEFGHFIVAKKCGILVREFSIGMGPKLFQVRRNPTTYTIRWLPLGGYVRLASKDDEAELKPGMTVILQTNEQNEVVRIDASGSDIPIEGLPLQITEVDLVDQLVIKGYENGEEDKLVSYQVNHDATVIDQSNTELIIAPRDTQFQEANVWQKLATNVAGPLMNIVLGFVVFLIWTFTIPGPATTTIGAVEANSPAEQAAVEPGSKFVSINGHKTTTFNEISNQINASKGKALSIVLTSHGKTKTVSVKPKTVKIQGQKVYQIGIKAKSDDRVLAKAKRGWDTAVSTTGMIFNALGGLIRHFSLNKLSGPVGIYSQTSQVSQLGFTYLLAFLAMISINLGIVNLVPIPGLDGGKLLLNLIEIFRGKPISEDHEAIVELIGFGLLLLLIIAVTGNDIYRYFIK